MEKPVLVVMAAGMGSRYGGLKQIDPVGANGQLIIDYSIYDARRAGFETVVFVIKRELAEQFRAAIGDRLSRVIEVKYAYQELEDLPAGYGVPEGRVKPWGTCHAVLAARKEVDGPFAVINSDDYYGPEAFREMGAEEAFLRIRRSVDSGACLHQLGALAGAELGLSKAALPPERFRGGHLNFLDHGRSICSARKPDCARCALAKWCGYGKRAAEEAADGL